MGYFKLATLMFVVALAAVLELGACLQPEYDSGETERIVGGKDAENKMFPWTVAIYYEGQFVCTGSIISEKAVLTAAHCVIYNGMLQEAPSFHATGGDVNRSSSNVEYINFIKVTPHPGYDETKNDIAILEMAEPIEPSENIEPICIASSKFQRLETKKVVAMGYGQTSRNPNDKTLPDVLQYTPQRVVSNLKCSILFFGTPVPGSVLCARGLRTGVCHGDSGGPLVFYQRGQPIQVGVAAYVNSVVGCGKYLGPAGFTRVGAFTNFILKNAPGTICMR